MPGDYPKVPKSLLRAQKIAYLSDSAVRIPIIGVRVGLDVVVGLIPGVGDLIMLVASGYIVLLAKKMGLPPGPRRVMLRNCLIDFALGLLPVVGDIVDMFYRANKANVGIIERYWLAQHQLAVNESISQSLAQWEKEQS